MVPDGRLFSVSVVSKSGQIIVSYKDYYFQSSMNEDFLRLGQVIAKSRVYNAPALLKTYVVYSSGKFIDTIYKLESELAGTLIVNDAKKINCSKSVNKSVDERFITYENLPILVSSLDSNCQTAVDTARANQNLSIKIELTTGYVDVFEKN